MSQQMGDEETIRFLRAIIRRKNVRVVERRKEKDRRIAFFSFALNFDRRVTLDRRLTT